MILVRISIDHIAQDGDKYLEDRQKIIYLTPSEPLKYDTNKWVYKEVPTIKEWYKDMDSQFELHQQQQSNHLAFSFPENEQLDATWLECIKKEGFELGILEFYIIEGKQLAQLASRDDIVIQIVDNSNKEDYLNIFYSFALPYGKPFALDSVNHLRRQIQNNEDSTLRLIAYLNEQPVGSVNIIETEETVEIDSFGVLESHQRQGIGSTLQAYIGQLAGERPVILVADGEDTAREMYVKQGYTYQSFIYHIVKENIR
ncbi:GNAT family N-acetyltransferase [Staphylococcus taiwanensis]|nr:GNAT family N-acetyltransferase [Staphylococcus taiwanensis]